MIYYDTMFKYASMGDIKEQYPGGVYTCVRSTSKVPENLLLQEVKNLDILSPSLDLFFDIRNKKSRGEWNNEMFDSYFKPRLKKELKNSHVLHMIKWLKKISEDNDVLLLCYCSDFSRCHLSVVKEVIESM